MTDNAARVGVGPGVRVGNGVAVSFGFGVTLTGTNGLQVGYGLFGFPLDEQAEKSTTIMVNGMARRRNIAEILPKSWKKFCFLSICYNQLDNISIQEFSR